MRYMVSVIDDVPGSATGDEMAAIDAFNERITAAGHLVMAAGLAAPTASTVIDNRGERVDITVGPFVESGQYIAGFWIIDASDLDVALQLAAEGSKSCNRRVEVRPFL